MAKKQLSVAAQKAAKSRKAKAARDAKKAGNPALDRANAAAGKSKLQKLNKTLTDVLIGGKKIAGTIDKAAAKAVSKKPQFFGRKKAASQKDPEKVKAERNALHEKMMRVPWYAEHRAESIKAWVARREALKAKDGAEVDKINRKLDRINKERDAAREAWVKKGSVIPDAAPVKKEKKAAAPKKEKAPKKSGSKKGGSKKSKKLPTAQSDELGTVTIPDEQPVTEQPVTTENAGPAELSDLMSIE